MAHLTTKKKILHKNKQSSDPQEVFHMNLNYD